jgi:N-methylhydantoinase A
MGSSDHYDLNAVNSLYSEMRNEVKREMPVFEGKDSQFMGGIENRYYIDMHYKGETHEITVPVESSDSIVGKEDIEGAVNAFHSAHETLHTFANPDAPAYFMNLRVETIIHTEKPPVERLKFLDKDPSSALKSKRKVYFEEMGGFIETPIYNGSLIHCGNVLKGPCVVEEPATTIVVYPGQVARLTEFNNYEISIK